MGHQFRVVAPPAGPCEASAGEGVSERRDAAATATISAKGPTQGNGARNLANIYAPSAPLFLVAR
jgi:hypothetical protein